jgi:hypothetical protein
MSPDDFLDEIVTERTKHNPRFPDLVEKAANRRALPVVRDGRSEGHRHPRPSPLSEAAKRARAPRPPEELVGARHDRAHIETGKLIASVPLRTPIPK